jgi:hypothetical protein
MRNVLSHVKKDAQSVVAATSQAFFEAAAEPCAPRPSLLAGTVRSIHC